MKKIALMIMNAREIPRCMESFNNTTAVDRIWFRGFTEKQLETAIPAFIKDSNYDYYGILSDDVIFRPQDFYDLLTYIGPDYVTCGWCRMDLTSPKIAIRTNKMNYWASHLYYIGGHTGAVMLPKWVKKNLLDFAKDRTVAKDTEIISNPPLFPVYFQGYLFSVMTREMWIKFPFRVYHGLAFWLPKGGSDVSFCERVNKAGIPMMCVRDCEIIHLRSMENFIVGKVKSSVIVQKADPQAEKLLMDLMALEERKNGEFAKECFAK